jgi:hypothetical protein
MKSAKAIREEFDNHGGVKDDHRESRSLRITCAGLLLARMGLACCARSNHSCIVGRSATFANPFLRESESISSTSLPVTGWIGPVSEAGIRGRDIIEAAARRRLASRHMILDNPPNQIAWRCALLPGKHLELLEHHLWKFHSGVHNNHCPMAGSHGERV